MITLADVQSLPDAIAREKTLLQWVKNDEASYHLTEIDTGGGLLVKVFSDALKIAGVRINASATLEQQIADELDCMLLTAQLADMVWSNASKHIPPVPLGASADMASTARMLKENALIQKYADGAPAGIISSVGKHWILSKGNSESKATNYGWHFEGTWTYDPEKDFWSQKAKSPANFGGMKGEVTATNLGANVRVLQGVGTAHNALHTDYSQTVVLVKRDCVYEGKAMRLGEILADASLSKLISNQGPLPDRQPGVSKVISIPSTPPVDPPKPPKLPPPIKGTTANLPDETKTPEPSQAGVGWLGVLAAAVIGWLGLKASKK